MALTLHSRDSQCYLTPLIFSRETPSFSPRARSVAHESPREWAMYDPSPHTAGEAAHIVPRVRGVLVHHSHTHTHRAFSLRPRG